MADGVASRSCRRGASQDLQVTHTELTEAIDEAHMLAERAMTRHDYAGASLQTGRAEVLTGDLLKLLTSRDNATAGVRNGNDALSTTPKG